jgi:hypothetical protein
MELDKIQSKILKDSFGEGTPPGDDDWNVMIIKGIAVKW